MQNVLSAIPAMQAVDVAASLFNKGGLQSAFKRLLKQGSTGNGRQFELSSGHTPEGRTLRVTVQPPFGERLGLLFKTQAWTDPQAPSFSVTVPEEGKSLLLRITGMKAPDQDISYDCATGPLLEAATRSIDEKFFDWVLEASHLPRDFKPRLAVRQPG